MAAPVPLADFDPTVARAVVTVLRRAGLPVAVAGHAEATGGHGGPGELTVVVPEDRRDEALGALAAAMDEVRVEVAREGPAGMPPDATAAAHHDEEDEPAPLLFERLRRLGFLPVLLVPLMVVTLSQVRLPVVYAFALLVGGAAAVVAWRDGRRHRS